MIDEKESYRKSFVLNFSEPYMTQEWLYSEEESTDDKLVFRGYDADMCPMVNFSFKPLNEYTNAVIKKVKRHTKGFTGEVWLDDFKVERTEDEKLSSTYWNELAEKDSLTLKEVKSIVDFRIQKNRNFQDKYKEANPTKEIMSASRREAIYTDIKELLSKVEQQEAEEKELAKIPHYLAKEISQLPENGLFYIDKYSDISREWIRHGNNIELFYSALVNGYEVEEKRYYIHLTKHNNTYVYSYLGSILLGGKSQPDYIKNTYTKEEIENMDKRLFQFAELEGE